ncbi:MAG: VWA domain-containing protein [Acidobacteriaceae bacterium]|nr:VWA domain-containing protein [Acidobacteriaceae bacterium]MBV9294502.1 VWA domain-containing protein [Acidobacteriaceae bacterium]MBV9766403.1 VWA domain-containing protein [Acidobacteriaceae bacterium]
MSSLLRQSRVAVAALLSLCWQAGAAPQQSPPQDQPAGQEPTIRINVDLVNIFFTVRAKKGGQLIPNLEKNNFTIYEDGKQQTIQRFSRETDLPLTLGLLIDISASQERLIDIERQAASSFFSSVIRPKDEAFLISFGKSTDLLQDYTSSPRLLTAALQDLRGDGQPPMIGRGPIPNVNTGPIPTSGTPKGTLLFDAVYLASNEKLKSEVGRKALILITDGEDQGSFYDRRGAIEAAQRADAIIYSIYYVDRGFYQDAGMMWGGGGESDLRKMSEDTGGHVFTVSSKHPLNEIFREIQDELRNQYSIGYQTINQKRDDTFRRIEIKVDNPDYRVQARNGYYATKNDAQ